MWLSEIEVEAALYAVRDLVVRRRLGGQPIRPEIRHLCHQLIAASARGTEDVEDEATSQQWAPKDLIDTPQAAAILGCSTRWVRRIAAELDGYNCGGRWVFRRQAVTRHANRKGQGSERH